MDNLTLEEIEALPKDFLSAKEVSAALGISTHAFYRHAEKMPFPIMTVGRRYKIPKKPFVEYMRTGRRS